MMKRLLALTALLIVFTTAFDCAAAEPLKVCLVSGSEEYRSDISLAKFKAYLEERYSAVCTLVQAVGFDQLPGLEALDDCDVALFFTRRLTITGEDLDRIKKYCDAGRPLVAVRTASHGFQNWLDFDRLVLGGNYQGHEEEGLTQMAKIPPAAKDHPILKGIDFIASKYSLYKTGPLGDDAELLMTASIPGRDPQPSAWTRTHKGGRVFYAALGGIEDFENQTFCKLLANALFWTAGREVESKKLALPPRRPEPAGKLLLHLRTRVETFKGSKNWDEVYLEKSVPIAETAILICDMWDQHWCRGASERCGILAKKMNSVIKAAREGGIQIIHAPSETMGFYLDTPQRRRILAAPLAPMPLLLDLPDPPLPIDDSDGGCDTEEKPWYQAWTRQNAQIEIGEYDGISDNGTEIYNFLRQMHIDTVLLMGVHTNMCVLARPFAIKRLTRLGKRCVLVRDLTDAMYDPKDPPHVSHELGTQLVIQHIEKYWCPTITGEELLAGLP